MRFGSIARSLLSALVLCAFGPGPAMADPPPPGESNDELPAKPGAAALEAGTIFLTLKDLRAPESGVLFLSEGQAMPSLDQPVGSCRLRLRVPGGRIGAGTPLTVESVTSTTSPYAERGISSVTWRFAEGDPAESLFCDDVGAGGPSQGDVEAAIKGVLRLEPAQGSPE